MMKAALLVLGCLLTASPADKPKPKPAAQKCADEKIAFAQETACRYDGYVFCIPQRDKKLLAAVKRIAPTAENYAHQRCGETELQFMVPMQQARDVRVHAQAGLWRKRAGGHVGWQGWHFDDDWAGTMGQSRRIEAIVVQLY